MVVDVSPSTVTLDHLYAKKDILLEDDLFSSSTDFLNIWAEDNLTGNSDDDGLLGFLFGQDFPDLGSVSPPHSESTSSDSDMTPSPNAMDDAELSEILSSTSSPGLPQNSEDFTIDLGWNVDFDLPDVEGSTNNTELTTITASLPTTVTSSSVTTSQPTTSVFVPSSARTNKSKLLVLSSEEQRLLELEGVTLPTDLPLTKAEEKVLKKVRRKIKNKQSAQESRRKKKNYVEGLEERVKACTQLNHNLSLKVSTLEKQNKSLLDQLKELQALVASTHPTKAQAGTCLMVLFLAFGLVLFPINNMPAGEQKSSVATYAPAIVRSRTLLQVQEDYSEELPDSLQFNLSSSDYLKAAASPLTTQNKASFGDVTVELSDIERKSQENKIKTQKR